MGIKYLLTDLDGVIRQYPPERASILEVQYGLPSGSLMETAFEKALLNDAVCGRISDEEWRSEIARRLACDLDPVTVARAVQEWSDFPGIADFRVLQIFERNFPGLPMALLTNGTSRLRSDLEILGIATRFAEIFNSSEMGVCKPDATYFQIVLSSLGCAASEVLFIDDSIAHIRAAQALGIRSCHFTDLPEFERFVLRVAMLDRPHTVI